MKDLAKAILAYTDPDLMDEIQRELSSLADLHSIKRDSGDALENIISETPDICIIDMTDGSAIALALAERIRNSLAGIHLFFVADKVESQALLQALRVGAADFLCRPLDTGALRNPVKRALGHRSRGGKRARIISISSRKGGMGATTIAANLAERIASITPERVALMDLKLNTGDASILCGLQGNYSIPDLMKDLNRLDESLLLSSLIRHPDGFYVAPAPSDSKEAQNMKAQDLEKVMGVMQEYMDYIIADISHEYDPLSACMMDISDKILLVTAQNVPALKAAMQSLRLFGEVGYGPDKVKILLNRYSSKEELEIKDVEQVLEREVYACIGLDHITASKAANKGSLLGTDFPDSTMSRDIEGLARKLTGIAAPEEKGKNPLARLLSAVLGKK